MSQAMRFLSILLLSAATLSLTACSNINPFINATPNPCATPLTDKIDYSCIVKPNVLWRGAEPDTLGANALVRLGVQTVVDLTLWESDKSTFRSLESAGVLKRKIAYFRIRDSEVLPFFARYAADDHVARFIAITRSQAKPIFVHCSAGENRTGVMVGAYRILENKEEIETVIEDMKSYKGFWSAFDAHYLRSFTSEKRAAMEQKIALFEKDMKPTGYFGCPNGKCE